MQQLLQIMQTIIRPVDLVISRLEKDSSNLGHRFKFNYLKSKEDKCQLLMNVDSPDLFIKVGNENVHNSTQVKLLGIVFDTALNFEAHISKLSKKANQKCQIMTNSKLLWIVLLFLNLAIALWCGCSIAEG